MTPEPKVSPPGASVAQAVEPDHDAWNMCSRLNSALDRIGDYAHDHSTGPAVWDHLWEVRRMAYEAQEEMPPAALTPPAAPQEMSDAQMLDWLSSQGTSYGFEDMHEGNRWLIDGPYSTLRDAIRAAMKAQPSAQAAMQDGYGVPPSDGGQA